MKLDYDRHQYGHTDVGLGSIDLREQNLARINDYLDSPEQQIKFLERQRKILNRPPHYLFDQSAVELADEYIHAAENMGWLVAQTTLNGDMFWREALGSIVERSPLNVDLRDEEKRRKFSTTLVKEGIKRQRDILVVLRRLHELDSRERPAFFGILESVDMKAFGGPRELPDAHKVQFIGIGDRSRLGEVTTRGLFHFSDDAQVTYNEDVARATLNAMQGAFEQLESSDSAHVVSNRSTGKSTAFAALRQEFPKELYIVKLDKIIDGPEEVLQRDWPTREGQIAVFDRAEVLRNDPRATQFLVDTFKKAIFLESSDRAVQHQLPFFSI